MAERPERAGQCSKSVVEYHAADMVGRTLGRYRVEALIGVGGMGEVYRAHDTRLDRSVAIKVLPASVASDPDRLARFEREARALARLEHPNILAIHDLGADEGVTFSVTELLEGETLRARLARERVSWTRAVELAAAVADGLAAAHQQGIVHRDIKPENLFLTGDGRVKILDFGLAATGPTVLAEASTATQAILGRTGPGAVLGTVGYMAPEQVQAGDASARSDLFALGCVLYEMLTGTRAFARPTAAETLAAILAVPVPDVTTSGSDAPATLGRIVARCLEKQPDQRFQSATDLAYALRATLHTAETPAPVVAVPTAAHQPAKRWRIAAITAAAVVAVAAAGWTWWQSRTPAVPLDARKVVIATFHNWTDQPALDSLGALTRDRITTGMARIENVSHVPFEGGAPEGRTLPVDGGDARRFARQQGAGRLVDGAYHLEGDTLVATVRVIDVETGQNFAIFPRMAAASTQPSVVTDEVVSRALGAFSSGLGFVRATRNFFVPTFEAGVEWTVGSTDYFAQRWAAAEARYRRAIDLDPKFHRPKFGLIAMTQGARPKDAESWIQSLEAATAELTPWERARTQYMAANFRGDLVKARDAAAGLVKIDGFGTSLWDLALAEARLHRLQAFRDAMRSDGPQYYGPLPDIPTSVGNVDFATQITWVEHEFGDFERELGVARRNRTTDSPEAIRVAREVSALVALGRLDEATSIVEQSSTRSFRLGSFLTVLSTAAVELHAHGHSTQAVEMAAREVALRRQLISETKAPTPGQRSGLADALGRAGEVAEAHRIWQALSAEVGDNVYYLGSLGVTAVRANREAEARDIADRLLRADGPYLKGAHLYQRARVLAALGEATGAVDALTSAMRLGTGWQFLSIHLDPAFDPIRTAPAFVEWTKPRG